MPTLKEYIDYKRITVKSEKKIEDIRRIVGELLLVVGKDKETFQEKDLINHFNSYKTYKKKGETIPYGPGYTNYIKDLVKEFLKWYYPDWSLRFRNLNRICKHQPVPRKYDPDDILTKDDVQKLVQAEHSLFWKVWFLVYFYGGFRPVEVCKLLWSQVTFESEGAFIKVYSKKNNKSFLKFIPEDVVYYLKQLQGNESKWVFPSPIEKRRNKPISEDTPYYRLTKLSEKVLGKKINPYLLRHSIATILYNEDSLKDDDAANQMGHSISMKKVYNDLSESKIKDRARKIYIKTEDLPPEKKRELELQMQQQIKETELLKQQMKDMQEENGHLTKALWQFTEKIPAHQWIQIFPALDKPKKPKDM
ncbi:MAG: tyrosine-type recombinase/integrase [Candidatus Pacearchaeota archaeon]|jgi:integrase